MYRISVIPGDGIGPEVIETGIRVIEAAGDVACVKFDWKYHPFGTDHYLKTGEVLPDDALEEMERTDSIFLGAVGDPRVRPGILEKGLLLKMRFYFDQYVNLRPIKLYPGVPCPLRDKGPEDVNFYVVRENTEDFYVGMGDRFSSKKHEVSLEIRRNLYNLKFDIDITRDGGDREGKEAEIAYQMGIVSRGGSKRIIEYAFELAKKKGKTRVTSVDKANVLTSVYGLWREVFEEVSAVTMYFISKPEWFEVVVTPNMFGDIITDLGGMIQGGIGLAPSGNINPGGVSMFEPVHGSAPDLKGKGAANPIAAILAGQMMLEQLGEQKAADIVENAVIEVLKEGKVRTRDLGGSSKTDEGGRGCRRGEGQGRLELIWTFPTR